MLIEPNDIIKIIALIYNNRWSNVSEVYLIFNKLNAEDKN